MPEIGSPPSINRKKREYAGVSIYHFFEEEEGDGYYLSSYKNLLLLSKSKTLVDEAIRQLNAEFSLKDDLSFNKLFKTANQKDPANIYLHFQESTPMLQGLLPRADLTFVPKMGEWMELDLQLFGKELIMSGLSVLPESGNSYLNVFGECDGSMSQGSHIVPEAFGAWLSLNFENAEHFYRSYEQYLERNGRLRKHQQLLEKLGIEGRARLLEWVDDEIGLIILPGKDGVNTEIAYLKIRAQDQAIAGLDSLSEKEFIEGYRGVILKKMEVENALPRVYGNMYENFHFPYYFVHEEYAVFSSSLSGLKGLVNDILDEKTLEYTSSYKTFNNHLPDRSNIKVVLGNPAALKLLKNLIPKEEVATFNKYQSKLQDFQYAAIQFDVNKYVAYSNFYLQSSTREEEKVSRVWSTSLDSRISSEPQFVMNHQTRKYDVCVQDEKNKLYLLDKQGKILWTKQLDGPIMGEINQVDAFRNKKLQLLFNTENSVYLLDRLGRDVESFPIKLKAPCTAPIAVLDYDKNRKYRILIPQGAILSNINIRGEKVKGWAFSEAPGNIISVPQHFSVAGKDIIVAQCDNGSLLQLNRRGEQRFRKIDNLPQFSDDFYMVKAVKLSDSELIAVGDDGMLYSIKPGGSTDKVYLDQDHPADDLLYFEDRYIFSSDKYLITKDDDQPWSAEFEADITQAPKAMILRGKFYAAAYSQRGEEIRLFDDKGSLISGFPVFAQGGFDMGSLNLDGGINIVTSSTDGTLICYRVN